MPVCNLCEQEKPASEFYTRQSRCKECAKAKQRERYFDPERYEANKAYAREYQKKLREAAQHSPRVQQARIARAQAREEERRKAREEKIRRAWERRAEKNALRYSENPKYREEQKARSRRRYRTDRSFFVRQRLRTRLAVALQQAAYREVRHNFEELVGCSADEFVLYMESKFLPGMTWDNFDQWHIDHIIPLTSFDLLDRTQLKQAFHYTNMQPLWAEVNTHKGNRVVSDDELTAIIRDVVGDDA